MRVYFLTVCLALTAAAAVAAPEGFSALPSQTETVAFEGQTATVTIDPSVNFVTPDAVGDANVLIHVESDLNDLRRALLAGVVGKKVYDECGDRVNISAVTLGLSGTKAKLSGTVRYERWECVKTKVPEFKGLKIYMRSKTLKTKLLQQTARFEIDLMPQIVEDGKTVKLKATVTDVRPSRKSALGRIASVVNIKKQLEQAAQAAVGRIEDKLRVSIPDDIRALDPRFTSVRFTENAGRLGIVVEGKANTASPDAWKVLRRVYER